MPSYSLHYEFKRLPQDGWGSELLTRQVRGLNAEAVAMAKSTKPVITVKIPINWERMTGRAQRRLRQIIGRDTRVIRKFFGIIEENEEELLRGKNRDRIDENKLHAMTMTAERVTGSNEQRLVVEHDLKAEFPRVSANELSECRKVAVANYESYLALRKSRRRHSRPAQVNGGRRIPRRIFIPYRAKLVMRESSIGKMWLEMRDSLDSAPDGRRVHDRLSIPLKTSPFHLLQLERGEKKSVQVFTDRRGKWWAAVAVRLTETVDSESGLSPAVLGIDLGINRAICTTLLTVKGVSETRYFVQHDKIRLMRQYDKRVADLQRALDEQRNQGLRYDNVARELRRLRSKREDVSKGYDKVMVSRLLTYIEELSEQYSVYVAIGRLKGIRNTARKGNYRGRRFRRLVHRWSFGRVTRTLKHGLEQLGWQTEGSKSRFQVVPENWTSITCWKCGRKGVRPKQSLFVCHTCGFRTNADRNGSLNIARRLITLIPSLRDEDGLGRWATPERGSVSAPKAARQARPAEQKSALSHKGDSSIPRESAAVHYVQTDLAVFCEEVSESDDDRAVAKTVEDLSVAGSDDPAVGQEKDARAAGGAPHP